MAYLILCVCCDLPAKGCWWCSGFCDSFGNHSISVNHLSCSFFFQMQDVREEMEQHDLVSHYLNPPSKQSTPVGFVVRDAPWDNIPKADAGRKPQRAHSQPSTQDKPLPPDTSNIADFPCIGSSAAVPRPTAWGPSRR